MKSLSALRIFAFLITAAALAACGGGAGGGAAIPSAPADVTPTTTPMRIISQSSGSLTLTGNVVALGTNSFQIQGGTGVGYLWIYTTSSTTFSGAKPYVGEIVEVSGTGSTATSVSASSVTQLLQVTGPVVALKTGAFQVHGPVGVGYLWIYTTSSTVYSGTKPFVGETVTVQGTGSFSTSLTAVAVSQVTTATPSASPSASPKPTASPTAAPTAAPTLAPANAPAATAFMPSSWGKIAAMQVFDETSNGYVTPSAAAADGSRYASVWGARPDIAKTWLTSNAALQNAYYNALETDSSSTSWGAIGHTLSWWQSNHPDWVLYACTSTGSATTTPAYVPGLTSNVPLDIHNPAVVQYQIQTMAAYAHAMGYHALAIDEATFWQADEGVSGGYGCGIYQNGSFVRRYTGTMDPNWASDVVAWVKQAHAILTTDPTISTYHLKLIVNHPEDSLTANETAFLANVDADLNENGYTTFGRYQTGSANTFLQTVNWTIYAQKHGVAILTDDNWGTNTVGAAQLDYSVATYLMGNEQAEALYASPASGFGTEQWHSQYQAAVGAPCGEYYSAGDSSNPSIYYRRFANAIVVINAGSGSYSETAHLPTGHTYTDLFGRSVGSPLSIPSNNGYVLQTSNGCQ